MAEYTESRSDFLIDWGSDSLEEQLEEAMLTFRGTAQAMLTFLQSHGYNGEPDDSKAKEAFIKGKFEENHVPLPDNRTIKGWVNSDKLIKRDSDAAIKLCFAFSLSIDEMNDFYRRICLARGLDCHNYEEAIYYFCLKNRLPYQKAEELKSKIGLEVKPIEKIPQESVLYTNVIQENIEDMDESEFITFLQQNAEAFLYNNATAYSIIRRLYDHIDSVVIPNEEKNIYTKERRKYVNKGKMSSWEMIAFILELNENEDISKERSLKPIIKDNVLLHEIAADCFPDRQGLSKVLAGEHLSYEKVRKLLILLSFYAYWGMIEITRNGYREVTEEERERFLHILDDRLSEAGYPNLYPGNPYDWIFLTCTKEDSPLSTLRWYMDELTDIKAEFED